jgi:hypothetical protein
MADKSKPERYPSAVLLRVHPAEREQLNADAAAAGLSLQNFLRSRLGLPLPERRRRRSTSDTTPPAAA